MRFDSELHFQYWGSLRDRPESQADIAETMSLLGACWMMERERYWELGGMDESHGSWGQMGTEIACKTWLSGGRLVVNKTTWFSHLFRTQPGFGFPYPNPGVEQAREYSRHLWYGNNWSKQIYPLSWLLEKFAPIPGWHEEDRQEKLNLVMKAGKAFVKKSGKKGVQSNGDDKKAEDWAGAITNAKKCIVYYTCNAHLQNIDAFCREQLLKSGVPIVCISLNKELNFGDTRMMVNGTPSPLMMHRQILMGLEKSDADIVFLCESDVIYHPSHFDFIPPRPDTIYYNTNVWRMRFDDGFAVWTDDLQQVSGICASRQVLLDFYTQRLEQMEKDGFNRHYEPGSKQTVGSQLVENRQSEFPNICIRHDHNLTKSKWSPSEFRNQIYARGWREGYEVPGWGDTRFIITNIGKGKSE
jgi:hypothetical protein